MNHIAQKDAEEILKEFSDELTLLEDIYLKGISYSNNEDYDGTLLLAIISADKSFLCRYLNQLMEGGEKLRFNSGYDTERLLKVWDAECFIDFADMVFDYLHEQKNPMHWLYDSPLSKMLCSQSNHLEIIPKQDLWIEHIIERYSSDGERMYELFSAIEELPHARRKKAVEKFLMLNSDPDIFSRLPLEPYHWGVVVV